MTSKILSDPFNVEFSRKINIPALAQKNACLSLKATEEECNQLSKRFELESLKRFEITLFFLERQQPHVYPLKAHFKADVIYMCVKTLSPFPKHIEETVSFIAEEPSLEEKKPSGEELVFTGEEDIVEVLDPEGYLDIGEIMAQYLSLALDPYPYSEESCAPKEKQETLENLSLNMTSSHPSKEASTYFPFQNIKILKREKKSSEDF